MPEIHAARLVLDVNGRVLRGAPEGEAAPGIGAGAALERLVVAGAAVELAQARERARRGERVALVLELAGGAGPAALVLEPDPEGVRALVLPLARGRVLGARDAEALAHGLSHDLGAHVRSLASFAAFLREDAGNLPAPAAEDLARIDGGIARLRAGLEGAVAYLRAPLHEAGQASVREVALQVARALEPAFAEKKRALVVEGADARVPVPGARLDLVLRRLVENALEFGGGTVRVRVERERARVRVSVADEGAGLGAEESARALEAFTRLRPRAPGETHPGLGLATVARAVRSWGGTLALGRPATGGLEATIELPAIAPASADEAVRRAG